MRIKRNQNLSRESTRGQHEQAVLFRVYSWLQSLSPSVELTLRMIVFVSDYRGYKSHSAVEELQ